MVRKPPKWPRQWHGSILVAQDIRSGSFYGARLFFPPFSPSFRIKSADSTLRNAENTKLTHRKREDTRLASTISSLFPRRSFSFPLVLPFHSHCHSLSLSLSPYCLVCIGTCACRDIAILRKFDLCFCSADYRMSPCWLKENDSSAPTCFPFSRIFRKWPLPSILENRGDIEVLLLLGRSFLFLGEVVCRWFNFLNIWRIM